MRPVFLMTLTLFVTACTSKPSSTAADNASWRKPGDVIDSILPMAEYIRRFRTGTDSVAEVSGGATTRDRLARDYLAALAQRDTLALAGLLVSQREFAWLVFPDHRYAEAPYTLDPAIFWGQLTNANAKGIARALQRYGGVPMVLLGLECDRDTLQLVRGPATLWGPCTVNFKTGDSTLTRRVFGSIIERDGRAKFLSFANEF